MVIRNAEVLEYVEPLKKMFPKGAYWDKLLSDENSDVSLVCRARAEAIALFRSRMNQLQREAWPDWADETISDWGVSASVRRTPASGFPSGVTSFAIRGTRKSCRT